MEQENNLSIDPSYLSSQVQQTGRAEGFQTRSMRKKTYSSKGCGAHPGEYIFPRNMAKFFLSNGSAMFSAVSRYRRVC